jgi:hypothetical protein
MYFFAIFSNFNLLNDQTQFIILVFFHFIDISIDQHDLIMLLLSFIILLWLVIFLRWQTSTKKI